MRKLRIALIVAIAILSLAAFKTLTPAADASKACLLDTRLFALLLQ